MANEFGEALRAARKGVGMRLSDLAAALGVSVPYLHDVEHGRRPPLVPQKARLAGEVTSCRRLADIALKARLDAGKLDVSSLTSEERAEVAALISAMLARRAA